MHIFLQALKPDVNYALLDLSKAKKPKKNHRHNHAQGCNNLPAHLTSPANSFLEVDIDMDAKLPPGDGSLVVSQSSIYLNSQQIAKEVEDMGRGQHANTEAEASKWVKRGCDEEEMENRQDCSNGNICTEAAEAEGCHGDTDQLTTF